jgi:hypothetical protein
MNGMLDVVFQEISFPSLTVCRVKLVAHSSFSVWVKYSISYSDKGGNSAFSPIVMEQYFLKNETQLHCLKHNCNICCFIQLFSKLNQFDFCYIE